jgi:NADH-quinone oxidoreductase subunit G/NADP-reducing hydrogenase subunit HndD
MGDIKVTIDGIGVIGNDAMTILEAAEKAGIKFQLCHMKVVPERNCRICLVELEKSPRLVAACHTPIAAGMVVHTQSPQVKAVRKINLELLMIGHTGTCVTDIHAHQCRLHNLASEVDMGPPRFKVKKSRYYLPEPFNPYVKRDMSACILCRNCVRACRDIAKKDIYAMAYRGFRSKVVVDCDVALNKAECKDCGICIEYCPTSALTKPMKEVL